MKRIIVTLVSMLFLMRCYAQHYLHVYSKSTPLDTVSVDSVSIRYTNNKLCLYRYSQRGIVFWKQLHLQKENPEYGFLDPIKGCIIIDKDGNVSYSHHPKRREIIKVSKMDKETLAYILKQSTTHMSHYDHASHMSHLSHYSSR